MIKAASQRTLRPTDRPQCRLAVSCKAVNSPATSSSSSSSSSGGGGTQWQQRLASAAVAASLLLSPVGAAEAAQPQQLADLLRDEYSFVDANSDGIVTKAELQQFVKNMSTEDNLPLIAEEQLDFTMKLFDLNQDGKLTEEEVLRALVLDGAVNDEAVDADVFDLFDRNNNGFIEPTEFRDMLGDLGPNGDAMKDFVFDRVNQLSGSDRKLPLSAFANALVLVRATLLGY